MTTSVASIHFFWSRSDPQLSSGTIRASTATSARSQGVTRMLPLYVSIVTLPSAARGSVFETVRSATAGEAARRRVRTP